MEEAAAFPVRVGDEIDHLEAAVILKADAAVPPETLRAFVAERLSWYAVPGSITVVESFPRTTSGKIDRHQLQTVAETTDQAR